MEGVRTRLRHRREQSKEKHEAEKALAASSVETSQEEKTNQQGAGMSPGSASHGSSSPEPNCSICLGKLENKSFTDSCFHMFCFVCLLEWSKVKAECPLCKQPFKSIIHNVRSYDDYDQYLVQKPQQHRWHSPNGNQRFRYRTTVTFGRFLRSHVDRAHEQREREIEALQRPSRITTRPNWTRQRQASTSEFRRRIYVNGLRVSPLQRRQMRYRDISPAFFQANPACTHRLVPWLNRELNALLQNHEEHVQFVLDLIVGLITRFEISSEEFYQHVYPFIGRHTRHFMHEFASFASSPYSMNVYDQHAVYEQPPQQIESDSSSDADSDIVVLSPPSNVPPSGESGSGAAVVARETPAERRDVFSDITPLLSRVRNFLERETSSHVTSASGWDSPIPGPSWGDMIDLQSTVDVESYQVDANLAQVVSSTVHVPSSTVSQSKEPVHINSGDSSSQASSSDSDSSSGNEDDVIFVKYDKPWQEREPIVLSSDFEEGNLREDAPTKHKKKKHHRQYDRSPSTSRHRRSRSRTQRDKSSYWPSILQRSHSRTPPRSYHRRSRSPLHHQTFSRRRSHSRSPSRRRRLTSPDYWHSRHSGRKESHDSTKRAKNMEGNFYDYFRDHRRRLSRSTPRDRSSSSSPDKYSRHSLSHYRKRKRSDSRSQSIEYIKSTYHKTKHKKSKKHKKDKKHKKHKSRTHKKSRSSSRHTEKISKEIELVDITGEADDIHDDNAQVCHDVNSSTEPSTVANLNMSPQETPGVSDAGPTSNLSKQYKKHPSGHKGSAKNQVKTSISEVSEKQFEKGDVTQRREEVGHLPVSDCDGELEKQEGKLRKEDNVLTDKSAGIVPQVSNAEVVTVCKDDAPDGEDRKSESEIFANKDQNVTCCVKGTASEDSVHNNIMSGQVSVTSDQTIVGPVVSGSKDDMATSIEQTVTNSQDSSGKERISDGQALSVPQVSMHCRASETSDRTKLGHKDSDSNDGTSDDEIIVIPQKSTSNKSISGCRKILDPDVSDCKAGTSDGQTAFIPEDTGIKTGSTVDLTVMVPQGSGSKDAVSASAVQNWLPEQLIVDSTSESDSYSSDSELDICGSQPGSASKSVNPFISSEKTQFDFNTLDLTLLNQAIDRSEKNMKAKYSRQRDINVPYSGMVTLPTPNFLQFQNPLASDTFMGAGYPNLGQGIWQAEVQASNTGVQSTGNANICVDLDSDENSSSSDTIIMETPVLQSVKSSSNKAVIESSDDLSDYSGSTDIEICSSPEIMHIEPGSTSPSCCPKPIVMTLEKTGTSKDSRNIKCDSQSDHWQVKKLSDIPDLLEEISIIDYQSDEMSNLNSWHSGEKKGRRKKRSSAVKVGNNPCNQVSSVTESVHPENQVSSTADGVNPLSFAMPTSHSFGLGTKSSPLIFGDDLQTPSSSAIGSPPITQVSSSTKNINPVIKTSSSIAENALGTLTSSFTVASESHSSSTKPADVTDVSGTNVPANASGHNPWIETSSTANVVSLETQTTPIRDSISQWKHVSFLTGGTCSDLDDDFSLQQEHSIVSLFPDLGGVNNIIDTASSSKREKLPNISDGQCNREIITGDLKSTFGLKTSDITAECMGTFPNNSGVASENNSGEKTHCIETTDKGSEDATLYKECYKDYIEGFIKTYQSNSGEATQSGITKPSVTVVSRESANIGHSVEVTSQLPSDLWTFPEVSQDDVVGGADYRLEMKLTAEKLNENLLKVSEMFTDESLSIFRNQIQGSVARTEPDVTSADLNQNAWKPELENYTGLLNPAPKAAERPSATTNSSAHSIDGLLKSNSSVIDCVSRRTETNTSVGDNNQHNLSNSYNNSNEEVLHTQTTDSDTSEGDSNLHSLPNSYNKTMEEVSYAQSTDSGQSVRDNNNSSSSNDDTNDVL